VHPGWRVCITSFLVCENLIFMETVRDRGRWKTLLRSRSRPFRIRQYVLHTSLTERRYQYGVISGFEKSQFLGNDLKLPGCTDFSCRCWFLIVLYSYFTSILFRYRDNEGSHKPEMTSYWFICQGTLYTVSRNGFWKGEATLQVMLRFRVIRSVHFDCDFPTGGKFVVVWAEMTPKR